MLKCELDLMDYRATEENEIFTWLFADEESGEEFFVEAPTEEEATKTANTYFEAPTLCEKVPTEWAEMVGLDTY